MVSADTAVRTQEANLRTDSWKTVIEEVKRLSGSLPKTNCIKLNGFVLKVPSVSRTKGSPSIGEDMSSQLVHQIGELVGGAGRESHTLRPRLENGIALIDLVYSAALIASSKGNLILPISLGAGKASDVFPFYWQSPNTESVLAACKNRLGLEADSLITYSTPKLSDSSFNRAGVEEVASDLEENHDN